MCSVRVTGGTILSPIRRWRNAEARKAVDKPKKASIVVKGKKDNLNAPMLPLTTPITVRVQRSDGDACFEAVFGAPKTNKDGKLAGKSD